MRTLEKGWENERKWEKAWEKERKCGKRRGSVGKRKRLRENENTPERNCVCKKSVKKS